MITLCDELQKQHADLHLRISATASDLSTDNHEVERLKGLQVKVEEALASVEDKLELLAYKKQHLIEEKAMLQGQLKQLHSSLGTPLRCSSV